MARRFENIPDDATRKGRRLLEAVMQEIPFAARFLADAVRLRTLNRFHSEMTALARHIGASWREIMLANISYDLALTFIGCSTIVVPTPDGPVLARNMDWWPEEVLAQTSYLVRYHKGGRLAYANAGWPGSTGVVTGMSGRGFAIALNAVLSEESSRRAGYPVLLHIRRVLEDARDFDDAVERLASATLVAPALLTVAGTENDQRVVVERSPKRAALRWAEPGKVLVTTNDYRLLFRPETHNLGEIYQTTCNRFDTLTRAMQDHQPNSSISDSALLYSLTSPDVIQQITAQHIILRPRSGEVRMFVPRRLLWPECQC